MMHSYVYKIIRLSDSHYNYKYILFFSVVLMKEKLDSEGLGIILVTSFMEEFFPKEKQDEKPKTFVLCHYNGIKRSNEANKVSQCRRT